MNRIAYAEAHAYIRSRHRRVSGWLQQEAAQVIAYLATEQEVTGAVGEIGVHHGKLFLLLCLLRSPGEAAVAVDLFENQELNVDGSGRGDRDVLQEHLRSFSIPGPVDLIGVDSTKLTSEQLLQAASGQFRLFSIDGGHTAAITESDLELAAAVMVPGGLIVLDDYFNVAWPGVSEGLNRYLLKDPPIVAIGSAYGKTFLCDRASTDFYRGALRNFGISRHWRVTEQDFHGEAHVIFEKRSTKAQIRFRIGEVARALPGSFFRRSVKRVS